MDELFWQKVKITSECWEWQGYKNANGYGWIKRSYGGVGINYLAHRFSYLQVHGSIPKGLSVLHKCDNPACVRPSHLFLGTQVDNLEDMHNKNRYVSAMRLKTHCIQGHPFSGDNLFVDNRGWRQCKTCGNASSKRSREKKVKELRFAL